MLKSCLRSVPNRREGILEIAREINSIFDPRNIESVAAKLGIVLVRTSGPMEREAGFAYIEYTRHPAYIESLSHPDEPIRVWGESVREPIYSIVVNTNSGIPEREVFWHEYYHLFHSPHTVQSSHRFEHRFSTEGVLHSQEERRADEFAAAVLIPSIEGYVSASEICERFEVSERLANHAIRFYSALDADPVRERSNNRFPSRS